MTVPDPSWIKPDWPAPKSVRALMSTRQGGVSVAPWDSMNLGDHVGDLPFNVQVNRQRFSAATRTRPVFLKQVHGINSVLLDSSSRDGMEADACISVSKDVACTVMVADCLPVLMCNPEGLWVAAAHAGWRGLVGYGGVGVLEELVKSEPLSQTQPEKILVWLGPCIGPQVFEVGSEVIAAFCDDHTEASLFFKSVGQDKWLADLAGLARLRLRSMGIFQIFGNTGGPDWCTVTQSSRFFSHRRDSRLLGQSGRMAAAIWLSD